jgi:hypothetical protein
VPSATTTRRRAGAVAVHPRGVGWRTLSREGGSALGLSWEREEGERREKWRDKAGTIVYHLLEREHREIRLTLEVSWMLAWRDNDSLKS